MVDGTSRKRKLEGDGAGPSCARVDAVEGGRAWELSIMGSDGRVAQQPIFTNSGLIVHTIALTPAQPQPRIHARPLTPVPSGMPTAKRSVSQILPVPPQFQLLSYHPPTLLSASQDPASRYLVAFYPLSLDGPLTSRKERFLTQGSLSGCLVLYANDNAHADSPSKPRYKLIQFWDLQSDAVDILWLDQPRQWGFDDGKIRRNAAPQALPGAGHASFVVLTAHGIAQLYIPRKASPGPSKSQPLNMQCLQCPITSVSGATPLQSMTTVPSASEPILVRRYAMARSPVDGNVYVAVEIQDSSPPRADGENVTTWDWGYDGFGLPRVQLGPALQLAKLRIDLLSPSGPTLTCTPLAPLDITSANVSSRTNETVIQHLAFRQVPRLQADENEEDDPLFASSPEDTKEKLPGTSSGLQLALSLVSRFDEPQSSKTAGFVTSIEVYDLIKVENTLLEGFAALSEPPQVDTRPQIEQMSYRRVISKPLQHGQDIRSLGVNPCNPDRLLLLSSDLIEGKLRLFWHNVEDITDLSHGTLVQQSVVVSFHPDDYVSVVAVSPGQIRGGHGVLAMPSPGTKRADLIIGGTGSTTDVGELVQSTARAVACAVLQGAAIDDALIAAAVLARQASSSDGLADRIVASVWQSLQSVVPSKSGQDAMKVAEDMLKVQHRCYSAFGDSRAKSGSDALKVVRANQELERYLDSSAKDIAAVTAVLPDALRVMGDLQRSIVIAQGKLEWVGQLDADAEEKLTIALNLVALSAIQGLAGNLVKLGEELTIDPTKTPSNVRNLEDLLRLQSQTSIIKDSLALAGIDFKKVESALGDLATDPTLAPPSESAAILFAARPVDLEAAIHSLIAALAGCSSAAVLIGHS